MIPSEVRRNYLAIIGDVRHSREIRERGALQKLMESGLERVNSAFGSEIAAGFVITLGDEFQGLLRRPDRAVEVVAAIGDALGETQVRYGLGWGPMDTELRALAVGMDGPCFHRARAAVADGKRADRWITVAGFGDDDDVLNGLLGLIGANRARWTGVQRETIAHLRAADTQREVALARGVNESSVSQTLKAALHEYVLAAERAAGTLLARHADRDPGEEHPRGMKR